MEYWEIENQKKLRKEFLNALMDKNPNFDEIIQKNTLMAINLIIV